MNIVISVVSHRHGEVVKKLGVLSDLAKGCTVVLRCNIPERLEGWAAEHGIQVIVNKEQYGFGYNNNLNYEYAREKFSNESFVFVILNPDVLVSLDTIKTAANQAAKKKVIVTIPLYLDKEESIRDHNIRAFPTMFSYLCSFFLRGLALKSMQAYYDKFASKSPDWCAGSFMVMHSLVYEELEGFDADYFMYCEDVDMCWRAKKRGYKLKVLPDQAGIHLVGGANRNILSNHFYWHLRSIMRFQLKRM